MKRYQPLKDVVELIALCDINQPDKDEMFNILDQNTNNFYPETANEEGVARWEQMLGITPDGTLKERKFKLKSVINNYAPYTERRIKSMINTLIGEDKYTFDLNGYELEVRLQLGTKNNLKAVDELLNNTLPAHIQYLASLQYNSYSMLNYTHSDLGTMTHEDIKAGIL